MRGSGRPRVSDTLRSQCFGDQRLTPNIAFRGDDRVGGSGLAGPRRAFLRGPESQPCHLLSAHHSCSVCSHSAPALVLQPACQRKAPPRTPQRAFSTQPRPRGTSQSMKSQQAVPRAPDPAVQGAGRCVCNPNSPAGSSIPTGPAPRASGCWGMRLERNVGGRELAREPFGKMAWDVPTGQLRLWQNFPETLSPALCMAGRIQYCPPFW